MAAAPDRCPLQHRPDVPRGRRSGTGSQSLVPYLAQSLATGPAFHAPQRGQCDITGQANVARQAR